MMKTNEWAQYKELSKEDILDELLREEMSALYLKHGRIGSFQIKKRCQLYTLVYFVALLLVIPLCKSPLTRIGVAVIFSILYAAIVDRLKDSQLSLLRKKAKRRTQTKLTDLVQNDSYVILEENFLFDRSWFVALICAIGIFGTLLADATILPDEYQVNTPQRKAQQITHINGHPIFYTGTNKDGRFGWITADSQCTLVSYDAGNTTKDVVIPAEVDGVPVTAIADRAFEYEARVHSISMPDSITEIGSYAFKGCIALSMIELSDNLISLGGEAFYGCSSLSAITIPAGVTAIHAYAFYGCSSLTNIAIPAGVTEIRANTFHDCRKLQTVNLHDGITAIHAYAFNGCSALNSITLPSAITEIRANTFEGCTSLMSVTIPEGVTRIAAHAFRGCKKLSSVSVPSTVTEIGSSAFRECKLLLSITIPEGCIVNERSFKNSPTTISRE